MGSLGLVTGLDLDLLIAQVGMHPACSARVGPGSVVIRWASELCRLRLQHDSFLAGTPAFLAHRSLPMDLVVPSVLECYRSSAVPHMFRRYPSRPSAQAVQADLALRVQRAAEGRPFRNTDLKQLPVALPYSPDLHGFMGHLGAHKAADGLLLLGAHCGQFQLQASSATVASIMEWVSALLDEYSVFVLSMGPRNPQAVHLLSAHNQ